MSQPELRQENSAPRTFEEIHITGEGFRTQALHDYFVEAARQRLQKVQDDYDAEVAEFHADPDNRGYRFPHCIHGSSLITDYDNICGGCEDGEPLVEYALSEGRTRWLTFVGFFDWMAQTPAALPDHIRKEIAEFSVTLFPKPQEG